MSAAQIEKIFAGPGGWALVGLVGIGVVYALDKILRKDLSDGAAAAGAAGKAVVDAATGIATGNNSLTAGTPYEATGTSDSPLGYEGWGIFGTLGAGANRLLGGLPEWIGEHTGDLLYEVTNDQYDPNAKSASIQSSTNNPYAGGTSRGYLDAVDNSPVNAQYAASPLSSSIPVANTSYGLFAFGD